MELNFRLTVGCTTSASSKLLERETRRDCTRTSYSTYKSCLGHKVTSTPSFPFPPSPRPHASTVPFPPSSSSVPLKKSLSTHQLEILPISTPCLKQKACGIPTLHTVLVARGPALSFPPCTPTAVVGCPTTDASSRSLSSMADSAPPLAASAARKDQSCPFGSSSVMVPSILLLALARAKEDIRRCLRASFSGFAPTPPCCCCVLRSCSGGTGAGRAEVRL